MRSETNQMKKMNKKGFTLAELLIVVAIIAVLVAIAIPVFTTQLEKSRQATDLANIRSSYAEAMAQYLTDNSGSGTKYTMNNKDGDLSKVGYNNVDPLLKAAIDNASAISGTIGIEIDESGSVTLK